MTAVVPETATDAPNISPWDPPTSALCFQPLEVLEYTYARPLFPACEDEPMTMVLPEMATPIPNPSPATVSDPLSSAVCFQPLAVLVNTYVRPPLPRSCAPATTV